jgi:hemerythrin
MSLFHWKTDYEVGIAIIDDQHKVLVHLINKLHHLIETTLEQASFEALLQELFDYTRYHFTTEEQLMEDAGYPNDEIERHKKQHQRFVVELNGTQTDLETLTKDDAVIIQNFLVNWLKNHILKVDMDLAEFLIANNKNYQTFPINGQNGSMQDAIRLTEELIIDVKEIEGQCDASIHHIEGKATQLLSLLKQFFKS